MSSRGFGFIAIMRRTSALIVCFVRIGSHADARESMQHAFGIQAYADIMSAFAAGERYLNRVWSASADGYVDEVNAYLHKASEQFNEALELFLQQRQQNSQKQAQSAHTVS